MTTKITHAVLSVSDKEGIVDFASGLAAANITLISTGGTAALLKKHGVPVIDVADYTGFPEMMAGRLKTLHPQLYGGILARSEDTQILRDHHIPRIGLVVVNLYPFEAMTSKKDCSFESAIENIDIGGPTLLRAAAKNYEQTTAVTSKEDYSAVLTEIQKMGNTTLETRFNLAKKVFFRIAEYDLAISNYFSTVDQATGFPQIYPLTLSKKYDLRYGENPHQQAAFYSSPAEADQPNIGNAKQRSGQALSYNNIVDADTALECVKQFSETACVIVKHANPSAVSIASNQLEAYQNAFDADASSAFGGIIAFNTTLEATTAKKILNNQFVELIIAPDVTEAALTAIQQKPKVRLLTVGPLTNSSLVAVDIKSVNGGILIQDRDNLPTPTDIAIVTKTIPTKEQLSDLLFAWKVVRFVKSNAIVFAHNQTTLGIGAGQLSRVMSSKIAGIKAAEANLPLAGAVMASDAFLPFRDGLDEAVALGIKAIIQPGGSIRDSEVIQAADEQDIAMVFTHQRHFKH